MRYRDDVPHILVERESSATGTFILGALVGAGVALLLAPRSGSETQSEIRRRVQELRDSAEGRVGRARESMTDAVERTRGGIGDRFSVVRDALESRTERARNAVHTGRDAARSARAELERRVDEAKGAYRRVRGDDVLDSRVLADADVVVTDVTIEIVEPRDDTPQ